MFPWMFVSTVGSVDKHKVAHCRAATDYVTPAPEKTTTIDNVQIHNICTNVPGAHGGVIG
jgi:hypothetical protein